MGILIIMGSLVYYSTVFLSETGVLEMKCLIRLFADKTKAIHRQDQMKRMDSFNGAGIEMSQNPMMRHAEDQAHRDRMAEKNGNELAAMAQTASKMQDALLKAKRGARDTKNRAKRKPRATFPKNRSQFNQQKTGFDMTDVEVSIEMAQLNSLPSSGHSDKESSKLKKKKKKKKGRGGTESTSGQLDDNTSLGFDVYGSTEEIAIEPLPEFSNPLNALGGQSSNAPVTHSKKRSTFLKHESA